MTTTQERETTIALLNELKSDLQDIVISLTTYRTNSAAGLYTNKDRLTLQAYNFKRLECFVKEYRTILLADHCANLKLAALIKHLHSNGNILDDNDVTYKLLIELYNAALNIPIR